MNNLQEIRSSKYLKKKSSYDKFPMVKVRDTGDDCIQGWINIGRKLTGLIKEKNKVSTIMVVDTYPGVYHREVLQSLSEVLNPTSVFDTLEIFNYESQLDEKINPILGDHPIFGQMNSLTFDDFFNHEKLIQQQQVYMNPGPGLHLLYGPGAAKVVSSPDIMLYADMARWEIQMRMRRHEVDNLGYTNHQQPASLLYKQAYFIDWRVADRHKIKILPQTDFLLDTNDRQQPKMIPGSLLQEGLRNAVNQPFRVVPFFDPGVWGGQWMKEVCDLDRDAINYAWCFDCVPEENSLLLGFGDSHIEIPALDLVLFYPEALLGEKVFKRFGAEFPIRFDFLDTMDGGNLSLQVHPMKEYIKEIFGMDYTQDESYYMLDVEPDAVVYLGLKENIDKPQMIDDLKKAERGGFSFDADQYVNKWPVKKHDHVLIPAGTIHCSGKNSMVLEISATPYIFTFKLWDWGRVDLNGQPRTISLEHGLKNIQWERDTEWTKNELINNVKVIAQGDGWREEHTGLHSLEFIETRRHWFNTKVIHDTKGNLNVLNLVEGEEVVVESPEDAFEPFKVHYAETFIIPAAIGIYTITPSGPSSGKECATMKAFVR